MRYNETIRKKTILTHLSIRCKQVEYVCIVQPNNVQLAINYEVIYRKFINK